MKKFGPLLFLPTIFALTPGRVYDIDCDTCICESDGVAATADDPTNCQEACNTFENLPKPILIWSFYEFLKDIGPTCEVKARVELPTEVTDWCSTELEGTGEGKVGEQKGWIIKKPGINTSVPPYKDPQYTGANLFRVWQKDATGWSCPGSKAQGLSLSKNVMPNPDRPTCPLTPPSSGFEWESMDRQAAAAYIEYVEKDLYSVGKDEYYMIKSGTYGEVTDCFGEITKIEWQAHVTATFQGISTMPKTTPPTGFEKGGAVSNSSLLPASLLFALASYLAW